MNSLIYNTGTVSVSGGSAIVEGNLTGWAVALVEGGVFSCDGLSIPILSVEGDTHLTLAYPWPGANGSGKQYAIARTSSEATARAATWTVDRLGKLAQTPWGVGVVPDGRGTLAQRDALIPMPNDDYIWLRVEVDEPAELYFREGGQWLGPYELKGEPGADSTVPGPAGDGFNPAGAWAAGTTYAKNDMVSHGPRSFVSFADGNVGNEPPGSDSDDTYWQFVPAAIGPEGPKGDQGNTGADGDDGWTPVFAVVADGARYVQQVIDWTGGTGAKPPAGQYVGPAGFVSAIGDAVNIRGVSGSGTGDLVGPASAIDGEMALFDGVTGKAVKGGGPPPTSNINLLKDAGRFAGSPEPQTATAASFVAPAYILPANGAAVSAGPKYIYNNNNYGGSAGNLDPDVDALISKLKDASYRRYGVEFYLMQITAGAGTGTARTINGVPHYATFSIPQIPLPAELTINCHVLVKSGSLGCGISSDPNWLYLDGERYTEAQQILPADGWRQVTRRVAYDPRQFVGYNNLVPQFFTTPGTVFYVAAFTVAPGIIPISSGKYYGVVPSLEAWRGPPTDVAHGNLGGGFLHAVATSTVSGFMSSTDKTKLDGIAAGATVNDPADFATAAQGSKADAALRYVSAIGTGEDLDTYIAPGVFVQNSTAGATGGANYPTPYAGMLEVLDGGGATNVQTVQRYTSYQDRKSFQRMRRSGGTWTAWVELASVDDISTKVTKANDTGLGGFTATSKNLGNLGSAVTLSPVGGNGQHGTNNAAVTITAPSVAGVYTIVLEIVNSATAGAVTLAGFTKTDGAPFTTANGDKFQVVITKTNSMTTALVVAAQ